MLISKSKTQTVNKAATPQPDQAPNRLDMSQLYNDTEFHIGLALAISSSLFIGSSFIIKKKALARISRTGGLRAGAGEFGYLKEWMWWMGFLSMGLGEMANFAAYAFAPASLVTPLGALSVIVAAILSSKYLKERLNLIGKLGCVLCILGSTIIVIHSPKEEEVDSLQDLLDKLDPLFLLYAFFVTLISFLIAFYYGPKYGKQNVIVYVLLCSAVGSLTVMACKGLGLALKDGLELRKWPSYAFLVVIVTVCVSVQMNYLNKALDLFNTSIVTPVYYVFFTTLVIIASAILFKEWRHLSGNDVAGNICGFFVIVVAIILLHGFKDMDVSLIDIRGSFRPKFEAVVFSSPTHTYGSSVLRSV